jgi:sugar transferase (PEP-CTERM/EpsH1 system associated)
MQNLLFLPHRIPYPPDKGDKIRSFHFLQHLAKSYRIHLGSFIDDPDDWSHVAGLREICADTHFASLRPATATLRALGGFVTGEALSLPYYRDRRLAAWVDRVLTQVRPDTVFVYSSAMAQYVLGAAPRPRRIVMDFIDVDSDKWRQYAETQNWPMNWVYRREDRTLLSFDRRVAKAADASFFVSESEADLFRRLAPESAAKVFAVGNGIDAAYFSPETAYANPYDGGGPALVFTGAMDYWPNVDAVIWFAREVFPRVRERFHEAVFVIVGSRPTAEVLQLGGLPGVSVTGRVADVRPYLAHAAAAVVPIRIARGIQNKVLEAMAMARPVVTTPQALEGIDAAPGVHLSLAGDTDAFAAATVDAVADPAAAEMGRAARARVVDAYGWPAKLAQFDSIIGG